MMQWDGSPHHWFGEDRPPCCLMGAIDDADSSLLGALFVPAESSVGYLRLLDMVLKRHGKPLSEPPRFLRRAHCVSPASTAGVS